MWINPKKKQPEAEQKVVIRIQHVVGESIEVAVFREGFFVVEGTNKYLWLPVIGWIAADELLRIPVQ
jgi:hypothetical protein